jgi:transposase
MTMRDELGLWYKDSTFAGLFPSHQGRPAESPGRLALITIMQFAEGLTDRQAAEAVRSRIDWKYALGLALTDPGFHHSVLSEYRQRLINGGAEGQLLEEMLAYLKDRELLKAGGKQRTDSTHVLAAIRDVNRLERIGEAIRQALNSLAVVVPDWLRQQADADWFELYGARFEEYRLPPEKAKRRALAERIGEDGYQLLAAVYADHAPPWLREVPAVEVLRRVWVQQFVVEEERVYWRDEDNLPPASMAIDSPYDEQARYSRKGERTWTGYKVHVTETCDDTLPHLITQVETTPATMHDCTVIPAIHQQLADKGLLPTEHLVDAGYIDAEGLLKAAGAYGVQLLGPTLADTSWQARAGQGFDAASFVIDWEREAVTCPQGKASRRWRTREHPKGSHGIEVRFDPRDCGPCPVRQQCTRAATLPRMLHLRPEAQHLALQQARAYQQTEAFRERYKKRAGVEGTISQGTRSFGLRRARYVGLAKTHLQNILTAAAINLSRAVAWLQGRPLAQTRRSPFMTLAPVALHT